MNGFFEGKRIIDIACGDRFSIVIAETYQMTETQRKTYVRNQKEKFDSPTRNRGAGRPDSREFQSTKMHI